MSQLLIRSEMESDWSAVRGIVTAAFDSPVEAGLVDVLRVQARPLVSLVAEDKFEDKSAVVGHILFSPVTLGGHPDLVVMGLAPMAVAPSHQNKGIGFSLVKAGLEACSELDATALVVLGHPEYYPRFGFAPSARWGIDSEYDVPEDVFMVMELVPGGLENKSGTIRYHDAFGDL